MVGGTVPEISKGLSLQIAHPMVRVFIEAAWHH